MRDVVINPGATPFSLDEVDDLVARLNLGPGDRPMVALGDSDYVPLKDVMRDYVRHESDAAEADRARNVVDEVLANIGRKER